MTIGFVGLGNMGSGMARNLAPTVDLIVFDVITERASAIHEAQAAHDIAEIAAADVVLLSLPGPPEVREAAGTLLKLMSPGSMLINLSTVSPDVVVELAEKASAAGIDIVDAPVTGAPDGASAGTLTVMVGATPAAFERSRPILDAFSRTIVYMGGVGSGSAAKLIVNMLWFVHVVALSDAMCAGVAAGIDVGSLAELLPNSAAASWVTSHDLPTILAGDRGDKEVKFTLALCNKDLALIRTMSQAYHAPVPLAQLAAQRFQEAQAKYGAAAGEFAVVRLSESVSGASLRA
jgi:3-hydroxyisobutyrate dehydrogenase-like beta-hydroxyacid dehydrogenase